MRERFGVSERRALRIVAMSRSAFSYKAKARDCSAIRLRMHEITQTRIHYGCERVLVMLRREGWRDDHKRVHRIYKEEGLSLRHCRPRRSRSSRRRQPIKVATAPNTLWGMDFVSDALFDGRRFRFNGRLRQECLNEHWFLSLADARSKIEAWRRFYNEERPHSALAWKTPAEFAREHGSQANTQVPKEVEISTG